MGQNMTVDDGHSVLIWELWSYEECSRKIKHARGQIEQVLDGGRHRCQLKL